MIDLLVVIGARPNFMKASSVVRAATRAGLECALVHTGQHYDDDLSRVFFDELGLPPPDVHLGIGSGSQAEQTARIMLAFEDELLRFDPAIVVVVGDVNSTLACALVAAKERYPVAHVEAGLRCHDFWMAEEINRRLCDHLSSHLFTTSRDADENLLREGIPASRISLVGNTMIDTLLRLLDAARETDAPGRFGVGGRDYAVMTLHRAENVDDPFTLDRLIRAAAEVSESLPVVFPLHPRSRRRLVEFGLARVLAGHRNVVLTPPLGYLDFVGLMADARLVLTDSGGIQEETTVLGVSCLTLRASTERPITVEQGTNLLVGTDPARIVREALQIAGDARRPAPVPELWDGRAGDRIVARLREALAEPVADAPPALDGVAGAV